MAKFQLEGMGLENAPSTCRHESGSSNCILLAKVPCYYWQSHTLFKGELYELTNFCSGGTAVYPSPTLA